MVMSFFDRCYPIFFKNMLLKIFTVNVLVISSLWLNAATYSTSRRAANRPKLVVGLVVDQMRWDYLYRFAGRYGRGGFKRLLKDGFACQNTYINYLPSFTACGHSSIYTGSVPAFTGITGNEWINRSGNRMYCTQDTTVSTIGSSSVSGRMSPRNLLSNTIGDELKLATNFRSKVVGIAIKDRGAILPAGHSANTAYWFDDISGNWITSSYYLKDLPDWVKYFNKENRAERYLSKGWNTIFPLNTYQQSTEDDSPYEGSYPSEKRPVFPHHFASSTLSVFKATPFANTLTFEFAEKAIIEEQLGADEIPDLLTISLSGTDYIGHQFGPNSVEIEDTYLRLDKDIDSFLAMLDKTVGKGNYSLFLTSDHGTAHNPTFLCDHQIPAGYWDAKKMLADLNLFLSSRYALNNLIGSFLNYQLNFNYSVIEKNNMDIDALKKDCIGFINQHESIAYAVDPANMNAGVVPANLSEKIINGYHRDRSGAIQIILKPAYFQQSTNPTGSIHGSWNSYDAHIPLILMGKGIAKGTFHGTVSICDIAPTISALLNIQEPNSNVGKVIAQSLIK